MRKVIVDQNKISIPFVDHHTRSKPCAARRGAVICEGLVVSKVDITLSRNGTRKLRLCTVTVREEVSFGIDVTVYIILRAPAAWERDVTVSKDVHITGITAAVDFQVICIEMKVSFHKETHFTVGFDRNTVTADVPALYIIVSCIELINYIVCILRDRTYAHQLRLGICIGGNG